MPRWVRFAINGAIELNFKLRRAVKNWVLMNPREDDETAFSERGRPCLIRVIDAISDLVSNDLSRRNCAALTLGRVTALSDECGLYVYKNHGLSFLLDALDSSNRGVHESVVARHLLFCLHNILKIKAVQHSIREDEEQITDLVKSCFHYFFAYYKVHDAVYNSARCLIIIADISPVAKKFAGASYYISEALRKFSGVKELCDVLAIMQNVYLSK
ncbi:unnamed protein product [Enterobius vermicularis]|uniref:Cnd1 domain-containing protein n=1 Tax=Enterobius vermicularis TaxID=51028 RepID=A0A0N4VPC2_ENTVE|nr:unnamed protein product [Enterobius vermicularis]